MLADTGCTSHYFTTHTQLKHENESSIQVKLPNGDVLHSSGSTKIPIPSLSNQAQKAHIFPKLTSANLLSIGQLCDDNCIATFDKHKLIITKNNKTLIEGTRNFSNGMWYVPIHNDTTLTSQPTPPLSTPMINVITKLHPTSNLIRFLHAAAFSPAPSTWIQAVEKGFFSSWPGLTKKAINTFLPKSIHTSMGHLDQERKNLRSTKPIEDETTEFETIPLNNRTHEVYTHIQQNHIYSDQTGKFPVQSNRGHNYLMIIYDYDTNSIHAEPLKNRSTSELISAYKKIHTLLKKVGCAPKLHTLDNEAPTEFLSLIRNTNKCDYEIVPPHVHRRNAAERAIRTFKNHFLAGISSVDPEFPLSLWDRLLPQAIRTLNMLRPTRLNPNISADAFFHGQHDFNKHPMAPPGTKTVAHLKPTQRASWAKHGIMSWYIGPSFDHYRCYRVYIPKNRSERVVDTVELFSKHSPTPTWDANKQIIQTAQDLTLALTNPQAQLKHIHANKLDALKQLVDIFSNRPENMQTQFPTAQPPSQMQKPPRVNKIQQKTPPRVELLPQNQLQPLQSIHTDGPPRVSENNIAPHVIPPDDDDVIPDPPPVTHPYMTRSKTAQKPTYIQNITTIHDEQRVHVDPTTGKAKRKL